MKRIALFLDGTWNKPDDNTNIWRLNTMVAAADGNGVVQHAYYDTGVGTKWYDKFRGGVVGSGLTGKVQDAYEWLVKEYDEGDEIFIFGFSRGAYTARSLAGLISRCGLLLPGASTSVAEVFEHYRSGKRGRVPQGRKVDIDFIGVFDTVGALGIPGISRKSNRFHNPNPSVRFKAMYHALAVDENRKPYRSTLWTRWVREGETPDPLNADQTMQQRWFVGVHSNVGGGYKRDALPQGPLAWIQQAAVTHGLQFRRMVEVGEGDHLVPINDSFKRFVKGLYSLVRLGRRFWRPIGADPVLAPTRDNRTRGHSYPMNEVIDATVIDRYRQDSTYRPQNLIDWASRDNIDLGTAEGEYIVGHQF